MYITSSLFNNPAVTEPLSPPSTPHPHCRQVAWSRADGGGGGAHKRDEWILESGEDGWVGWGQGVMGPNRMLKLCPNPHPGKKSKINLLNTFFCILSGIYCGNGIFGCQRAKNPINRGQIFFLQIGQYGYQKIQNFTLISKMSTYLSGKMLPKKVLGINLSLKNLFFGPNFCWVHFDTKVSGQF
jgi:hypothetical protein